MAKVLCAFCLDVSSSMSTAAPEVEKPADWSADVSWPPRRIDLLNYALAQFHKEIEARPQVRDRARLAWVSFAGQVEQVEPFPPPGRPPLAQLTRLRTVPANGNRDGTNLGLGLLHTLKEIKDAANAYSNQAGKPEQIWLLVLSDGVVQDRYSEKLDEAEKALRDMRTEASAQGIIFHVWCYALGGAGHKTLSRFETDQRGADQVCPADLLRLFVEFSKSVTRVSTHLAGNVPKPRVELVPTEGDPDVK